MGVTISGPRAETDTHYMIMGIDLDLDRATRRATWEVVDFRVSEVVDLTHVVTGYIPKDIFLR